MRDVALLALLYGVSEISEVFKIEEKVLMSWIQDVKNDPFFKGIRKKLMNQSREIDASVVARKYSISQNVINQLKAYRENGTIGPFPMVSEVSNEKSQMVKQEYPAKKIIFDITDLVIDEWLIAKDDLLVNTANFLNDLSVSFKKPYKRVKLNIKETMIAEVIREGTPLYRETALKYGLKPERVKEWVQTYQNDGTIREGLCTIRESSNILKKAYQELLNEI